MRFLNLFIWLMVVCDNSIFVLHLAFMFYVNLFAIYVVNMKI